MPSLMNCENLQAQCAITHGATHVLSFPQKKGGKTPHDLVLAGSMPAPYGVFVVLLQAQGAIMQDEACQDENRRGRVCALA